MNHIERQSQEIFQWEFKQWLAYREFGRDDDREIHRDVACDDCLIILLCENVMWSVRVY